MSNSIWDKPGPLSAVELERVRLHPCLTDRMIAGIPALGPVRTLAARHHERLDGSGYPSGLSGSELSPADRILAAADAYHAMTEPRPYRSELPPETATAELVVTSKTVSSHVEHIYTKLGVSSRARATHFATQHGLVGSYEAAAEGQPRKIG